MDLSFFQCLGDVEGDSQEGGKGGNGDEGYGEK